MWRFHSLFFLFQAVWVSLQVYCPVFILGCKKTKSDFSSTDSPCLQRRKPLGYWLPFSSFGDYDPPNSIGTGKVGVVYKQLWDLRYFHSSLLHWDRVYNRPTSFIWGNLSSSCLSLVRHFLESILGMPIITWCDDSSNLTTRAEKHKYCRILWKGIIPIQPPGEIKMQDIHVGILFHLVYKKSGEFRFHSEGSLGLSMFLLNTNLHVSQEN